MFGLIALIVTQAGINIGLICIIRKLDKKVSELSDVAAYHDNEIKTAARLINKLTYKP